ncbi:MAG: metallophosphatase family protein [Candidatus Krumholzibacteria bacterium]|nr:metallophosphatase family protein [Candidatus Krumholzibacteria bacterium]
MSKETLAVISDIHGNRWALEAVLEDIASRGIDRIVNLGDSAYGPLDPFATVKILMERGIPSVRGNEDRILGDRRFGSATVRFVRERLLPEQIEWLVTRPASLLHDGNFFMCHGTPAGDTEYLLRVVEGGATRMRTARGVLSKLKGVHAPVILCGHDHQPATLPLPGGRLAVNPGSVGLQAYTDDDPREHIVETGLPLARYCILSKEGGGNEGTGGSAPRGAGWRVEHAGVDYDHEAASFHALRNGRPDWAWWLISGKALNGGKA